MGLVRSIASLTLASAALSAAGCSVILDFPQCVDDVDCTNVEGIELVCRDSECQEPIPPETVPCGSDSDCVAQFDASVVCGSGGTCASLESEHCTLRIQPADLAPEAVVYVGSILPTTGTYATLGATLDNAVELAVEDFNGTAMLPSGRRVGWVSCDSRGKPEDAAEAARELTAMGIEAIIGPALSAEMVPVAEVTAPRGAFLISPTASAAVFAQLNDNDLVWRTIGNDAVQAAGIADRLATFDPTPERVVSLVKDDAYGDGLYNSLEPRLSGLFPTAPVRIDYSGLDSFTDSQTLLSEYGAVVAAVFDAEPDVVVILGSVEARELVLFYLEAWAGANPRPTLPKFLLSSEAAPVAESIVAGVSDSFRNTLMSRLEAVTHTSQDPDNYGPFEIRYEIRFPQQDAGLSAGLAYDAAMTTMLALSALPTGDGDGAAIAAAVARVSNPSGTPVSFGDGLSFITTAQEVLAAGNDVLLRGVSGQLAYDLSTGDLRRELTGYDVEPISGTTTPRLTARRRYQLDAAPAVTGTWVDL